MKSIGEQTSTASLRNTSSASLAVDIRNLSLTFRSSEGKADLEVLQSIDLAVRHGEFIAVVGPSGCGKTSVLRIIGGLLDERDTSATIVGTVQVGGTDPHTAKQSGLLGFAFQNPVLLPWRTVRRNIGLPLEILGDRSPEDSDRITSLLELMEIGDFGDAYPHELSGGMQQRVNIARTLVHEPTLLLMDEPFGSLDEVTREKLNLALLNIHRLKRPTVIFVTHSLREAVFLSDRVVILSSRPARVVAVVESCLTQERTELTDSDSVFIESLAKVKRLFNQEGLVS